MLREPEVPPELIAMENVVLFPHLGSASVATRGRHGPTGGRQPHGLGGGQAAAYAGAGDAVAATPVT